MMTQYRSAAMASIHETAEGLHKAGVMDRWTMRNFDEARLTPVSSLSPGETRAMRERKDVSQAVFARNLYVTTGLVSQWEWAKRIPKAHP